MTRYDKTSASHDWRTPEPILELVREALGGDIGLDPFTALDNPTRARAFCSLSAPLSVRPGEIWRGTDGWAERWADHSTMFANPEYGKNLPAFQARWLMDVLAGFHCGMRVQHAIALVPARTETRWWQSMHHSSIATCLWGSRTLGSRISFIDPVTGSPEKGNNSASTIFYIGSDPGRFHAVFARHGVVI